MGIADPEGQATTDFKGQGGGADHRVHPHAHARNRYVLQLLVIQRPE